MSQAEKREAGERLIQLTTLSEREIARRLAVDNKTVSNWREKLSVENSTDSPAQSTPVRPPERTVTRNGTSYTMRVDSIGDVVEL